MFTVFTVASTILPLALSGLLTRIHQPTTQQYHLMKSFSLLLLGMFLSSLATLNFSLAFLVGLFATPLAYLLPIPGSLVTKCLLTLLTSMASPMAVLIAGCSYWDLTVEQVLREAAYGWNVWGLNTQLVVWCVWWPAWLVGGILLWGSPKEL